MGYWIYHNEQTGKWEVKQWLDRGSVVVKTYHTRFAAYGIA